jgi:hypothetical protein
MVEWVQEVPRRRRAGKWQAITSELRSRPGEWARVDTVSNTAFATMLKQGKLGDAEPGEFEATCRRNDDGSYDIYARYVGTE